ncbi:RIPOR family member 3 isoform X4 [Camelus bactrianus]|uniref:RIPOR family member 3 isoform X4 n=1 Tax=Camelus bactrianus TaxID=9837 RepID=A0AC58P0G9_CAMBA
MPLNLEALPPNEVKLQVPLAGGQLWAAVSRTDLAERFRFPPSAPWGRGPGRFCQCPGSSWLGEEPLRPACPPRAHQLGPRIRCCPGARPDRGREGHVGKRQSCLPPKVTAMSVRVRFLSSGDTGAVGVMGRSASFAGFSSAQSRRITKSVHRNSVRPRMPAKSSKMYGTLRKGSVCLDPKPQQVKKIFEALKRGLKEYLCVQQAELDYLSGRHKDTRRNSRLAFYYDLDKQTRSVERHIRKMEFHISKVDELYEGYCIQCRLRDGASNMQRAFSRCPPSRASRESLQELGRSLQECTEDMWLIEGALEVHLGEFHVRMKGLVGYARLCPGDQYEVLMRLGRQRWKLRGRIESDDSQTWDEEEKAFIPTLRENFEIKSVLQQPAQQALLLDQPRATSILSCLSDGDLRGPSLRSQSQELPEMDSFSSEDPRDTETSTSASTSDAGFLPLAIGPNTSIEEEAQEEPPPLGLLPEMFHLAGGAFVEQPGWRNFGVESLDLPQGSPFHDHMIPGSQEGHDEGETEDVDGPRVPLERPLQEVLDLLRSRDPAPPQLRELEYQVLGFRDRLKPRGARQEHASADSLMECILESFSFLNAHITPHELALFGDSQDPRSDGTPPPPPSLKASSRELTAGAPELDMLLAVHLQICKALLQKLDSPNLSRMVQDCLLEEAAQQKQVLEMLSVLDFEKVSKATSVEEIVPQASRRKGCLKVWRGCTEPGGVLSCPGTALLNQLKKTFLHRVGGKHPGQLELACRRLLEQVVSCSGLLPRAGLPEEQTVTWFQFHSYLQRQSVSDLEKHFAQLSKEVTLVEELQCVGRAKTVRKLQGKRLGQLQPLPQTLRAWALLQLDGTPRVCRVASARLASAARNKSFREKALLFYTNALTENDTKLQQAACMALKHLRGIESIEQIASLCQSDLEAVRAAARETTLSFGEKGRLAFEKMDKLYSEQRHEAFGQEADVEITVF